MYLRTQGVNPLAHPVKEELDRIKTYFGKISQASKKLSGSNVEGSKAVAHIDDRKTTVNKEAAKRVVVHALTKGDDDTEALKDKSVGGGKKRKEVSEPLSSGEKKTVSKKKKMSK